MIKYNLECSCGETFESWFQNSNEYEKLLKKNLINCYVCGRSKTVKKSIMAPSVATSKTSVAEKDVEQKKEFFNLKMISTNSSLKILLYLFWLMRNILNIVLL